MHISLTHDCRIDTDVLLIGKFTLTTKSKRKLSDSVFYDADKAQWTTISSIPATSFFLTLNSINAILTTVDAAYVTAYDPYNMNFPYSLREPEPFMHIDPDDNLVHIEPLTNDKLLIVGSFDHANCSGICEFDKNSKIFTPIEGFPMKLAIFHAISHRNLLYLQSDKTVWAVTKSPIEVQKIYETTIAIDTIIKDRSLIFVKLSTGQIEQISGNDPSPIPEVSDGLKLFSYQDLYVLKSTPQILPNYNLKKDHVLEIYHTGLENHNFPTPGYTFLCNFYKRGVREPVISPVYEVKNPIECKIPFNEPVAINLLVQYYNLKYERFLPLQLGDRSCDISSVVISNRFSYFYFVWALGTLIILLFLFFLSIGIMSPITCPGIRRRILRCYQSIKIKIQQKKQEQEEGLSNLLERGSHRMSKYYPGSRIKKLLANDDLEPSPTPNAEQTINAYDTFMEQKRESEEHSDDFYHSEEEEPIEKDTLHFDDDSKEYTKMEQSEDLHTLDTSVRIAKEPLFYEDQCQFYVVLLIWSAFTIIGTFTLLNALDPYNFEYTVSEKPLLEANELKSHFSTQLRFKATNKSMISFSSLESASIQRYYETNIIEINDEHRVQQAHYRFMTHNVNPSHLDIQPTVVKYTPSYNTFYNVESCFDDAPNCYLDKIPGFDESIVLPLMNVHYHNFSSVLSSISIEYQWVGVTEYIQESSAKLYVNNFIGWFFKAESNYNYYLVPSRCVTLGSTIEETNEFNIDIQLSDQVKIISYTPTDLISTIISLGTLLGAMFGLRRPMVSFFIQLSKRVKHLFTYVGYGISIFFAFLTVFGPLLWFNFIPCTNALGIDDRCYYRVSAFAAITSFASSIIHFGLLHGITFWSFGLTHNWKHIYLRRSCWELPLFNFGYALGSPLITLLLLVYLSIVLFHIAIVIFLFIVMIVVLLQNNPSQLQILFSHQASTISRIIIYTITALTLIIVVSLSCLVGSLTRFKLKPLLSRVKKDYRKIKNKRRRRQLDFNSS